MGKLRIVSHSSERFTSRQEAGRLLADELTDLHGQKAVVLGIPRGGVVVARELAKALEADLDVVLARKLRTPGHPELAMGSVAEGGKVFLNESLVHELGIDESYIESEKAVQLTEIARRTQLLRRIWPKVPLAGRKVVITDDGVATGATTLAAIWGAHQERPQELMTAIPVGSEETVRRLAREVAEMVCLRAPPFFAAVGQFYVHFEPVEDEDVLAILKEEAQRKLKLTP